MSCRRVDPSDTGIEKYMGYNIPKEYWNYIWPIILELSLSTKNKVVISFGTSLSIKILGIEMFTIHIQSNLSISGLHFL